MKLNAFSKVYVACPAESATGGPELLHQLVSELCNIGVCAKIYYYNSSKDVDPVHPAYSCYSFEYVTDIEDDEDSVLIVPEVAVGLLKKFKNIHKVVWWLSVDNFIRSPGVGNRMLVALKRLMIRSGVLFNKFPLLYFNRSNVYHLVQSHYASWFLKYNGVEGDRVCFLGDYLNDFFITSQQANSYKKENIVIYNPKKGLSFTKRLIEMSPDIRFVAIEDMSRKEVSDLLSRGKVYIDFGNHPGRDRIPREAVISGACVITNRMGSAKFYEDVPIADKYKIEDPEQSLDYIRCLIKKCFDEYPEMLKDFSNYRDMVRQEHHDFIKSVRRIFLS